MLVGSGRSRRWNGRAAVLGLAAALCVIGLDGCSSLNPINLYRDMTGASKDDPRKDEANTANLEAGSQEPYPAVGSVPNPPTRGLTEAQREKLAQGLVADRNNARYIDEQVASGNAAAVMAPQVPVPEEQLPIAIPPGPAAAAPPAVPVPRPPAQPRSSGNFVTGGFTGHSGEAIPAAHTPVAPPAPVAADRESALQTPSPRAVPEPEAVQPPPPPPELKPLPPPQAPQPFPGAPALPPQPPEQPTQVAGIPVPPPPPSRAAPVASPPEIPPAPPVTTAINLPAGKHAKSAQIAEVGFVPGATTLTAEAPAKLKDVPGLHQQYGGVVRVVGYASLPQGGTDPAGQQLAAYQAALQRATLVKQALIAAGVPAADIVTEASPIHGSGAAADRADIYAEY
jgi:outer membrane protein OmpA-like peptidoglycan-associated protein